MDRRSRRPGIVLAAVAFGVFIAADDLTVVATMLRQIISDLEIPLPAGLDDAAWIVNGYLVAYVAVMPFMGRVSDVLGRRRVFVGSLGVFVLGSVWVPMADSLGSFVAARVVTAVGGGAMVPVAMAAIADVYRERRRATALGVLGAVDTLGWVWGPMFGAFLVRYLSWQWQFHLNIPLGLAGMAFAWWALDDHVADGRGRVDWVGAFLLAGALVSVTVALLNTSEISTVGGLDELTGRTRVPVIPLFAAAAVALVLFLLWERRRADPLLHLDLFRRPNVSAATAVNFLVGGVLVIAMVNVPLFVNVIEGDVGEAALASGRVLSALTISMAVLAYVGGRITEATTYRPPVLVGLVFSGAGFLLMGSSWSADTSFATMAWQLALLGVGFGLVTAPTNAAVVDSAPADQRGVAAAMVILFRLMGLAVGLSGLTAWGLYRFNVLRDDLVLPPIGDPAYESALARAQAETTASALAETFLFCVAVVAVAVAVGWLLQRRRVTAAR
ncbi:MAG: MFS transporter [Acidimicrobiia bacterium]